MVVIRIKVSQRIIDLFRHNNLNANEQRESICSNKCSFVNFEGNCADDDNDNNAINGEGESKTEAGPGFKDDRPESLQKGTVNRWYNTVNNLRVSLVVVIFFI